MRLLFFLLLAAGLAQAQPPSITNQPASRALWAGGNVTFVAGVAGKGPFTYQWRLAATNLPNGVISTVAGGVKNNGILATQAILNSPSGLAADAHGNLFFSDDIGSRIRKISANGVVTTVAGNGEGGYSGDGGPATNASLSMSSKANIFADASGNLFLADDYNNVIRKVSADGIISTVAGNGLSGFAGDGGASTNASLDSPEGVAEDSAGNLLIADTGNNRIRRIGADGVITTVAGNGTNADTGNGGQATNASLISPTTFAVDAAGDLFIAGFGERVIRKVDTNGIITAIATGQIPGNPIIAGSPSAVTLDNLGDLFIALGFAVYEFNRDGTTTLVAGGFTDGYAGDGGPATAASLSVADSMAVDASGNLFIADQNADVIRKVDTNGIITTVAGIGNSTGDGRVATAALLRWPTAVALDAAGDLLIADAADSLIRKVDTNGIITTIAGNLGVGSYGDGGAATNASLFFPQDLASAADGNLFIADTVNNRIREVGTNGIITTVAGNSTNSGFGGYSGDGGPATNGDLNEPYGLALDTAGDLFIADTENQVVRKVDVQGVITTMAGTGTNGYTGDGGPATNASMSLPWDVAVDGAGNLFIADAGNDVIREVNHAGVMSTIAGQGTNVDLGYGGAATNAGFGCVTAVQLDSLGNLFITDQCDGAIRQVGVNGVISTVAGNGTNAYSGDGGAATNASLTYPQGVTADAFGNLFIADSGDNRVRKVTNTWGPVLALNNVTAACAGGYQVVVTGPDGCVTSSVARLVVAASPLIYQAGGNADGSVTIGFVSRPNSTNQVMFATNLLPPVVWQSLATNVAGPDGDWRFTDTNAGCHPARFYRSAQQ